MQAGMRLRGKTALVTGSGRNIGRAIALAFAREGANVVVNARSRREEAEAVAAEARRLGVRALPFLADISVQEEVEAMVAQARKELGPIDILVNNAAILPRVPFLEMSAQEWNRVLGTVLHGAFFCCKAVIKDMVEKRWGRIIHIGGRGTAPGAVPVAWAAVGAAKSGMEGLSRALAVEFASQGITSNCLALGFVNTSRPGWRPADYEPIVQRIPAGRLVEPDEVAAFCVFLASDEGAYVTGQVMHVNGGAYIPF